MKDFKELYTEWNPRLARVLGMETYNSTHDRQLMARKKGARYGKDWQPHKDLNQIFEVVEFISKIRGPIEYCIQTVSVCGTFYAEVTEFGLGIGPAPKVTEHRRNTPKESIYRAIVDVLEDHPELWEEKP